MWLRSQDIGWPKYETSAEESRRQLVELVQEMGFVSHKWQGHRREAAQVHGVDIMTPCVSDAEH